MRGRLGWDAWRLRLGCVASSYNPFSIWIFFGIDDVICHKQFAFGKCIFIENS